MVMRMWIISFLEANADVHIGLLEHALDVHTPRSIRFRGGYSYIDTHLEMVN